VTSDSREYSCGPRGYLRETAIRYAREGKVGVFYRVDSVFGYALPGEIEQPLFLHVAESV
jgi:hypothetical protein